MAFIGHLKKLIDTSVEQDVHKSTNPGLEVARLVREMKTHLSGARSALSVLVRDERRMKSELLKLNKEVVSWHKKAEEALDCGDEKSARKCLRYKIASRKCYREIAKEHSKLVNSCNSLKKTIHLLQQKLKEAMAREKMLRARLRRVKRVEFLKNKFPEHKEAAMKMALEELDYDTERRLYSSFILEEDSLERKFRELEADSTLVENEFKKLKKK